MNFYLVLYNLLQTIGWAYVFYVSAGFLHFEAKPDYLALWNSIEIPLKIFQTAALLEILHALFGIVKSNVSTTAFQIFARVFMVWCILDISPPSQKCIGLPIMTVAWCMAEIIRYGYYLTNLLQIPSLFQWLRYSMFIILFPIGIVGELICVYYSIVYVRDRAIWTHLIPTALNFGLSFHYVIIGVSIVLLPVIPSLYIHMFSQRRKVLGGLIKRNKSK